jgi:hypothetical protein
LMYPEAVHVTTDECRHAPDGVGIEGRAQAKGVGKVAAVQAASPVRHSSWTMAGIPGRVSAIRRRCSDHSQAALSSGS